MTSYITREPLAPLLAALGCSEKTAAAIVAAYPRGRGLSGATADHLTRLGASPAQAARIAAAFRLVRAVDRQASTVEDATMHRPGSAEAYIRERVSIADLETERFFVLALDGRQRVLDLFEPHRGSVNQVDVHPREIFAPLVRIRAASAILAHNHPTGDPSPSDADVALTARLVEAGKTIGITVLDHLVLTATHYVSMAERGLFR